MYIKRRPIDVGYNTKPLKTTKYCWDKKLIMIWKWYSFPMIFMIFMLKFNIIPKILTLLVKMFQMLFCYLQHPLAFLSNLLCQE